MANPRRRAGVAFFALLTGTTAVILTACATGGTAPTASRSSSPGPSSSAVSSTTPGSTPSPPAIVVSSRVTHDWGRPTTSSPFLTTHAIDIPVEPPPAPPLPCLRQIAAGRHPAGSPGYDQVSFRFSGGFPDYDVHYVGALVSSGKGDVVPVPGASAIVRVSFHNAQGHGDGCATDRVSARIGYPAIVSYVRADDFEGYVDYGIGITANSGVSPRRIRVVEVEKMANGERQFVIALQADARANQ